MTLLSREAWLETTAEIGEELPPKTRRANLVVTGIDLRELIGRRLSVGEAEMQVRGETTPCFKMNLARAGLMQALVPDQRGGVFATISRSGNIRVGDAIAVWGEE